jgi:hypothetical protein
MYVFIYLHNAFIYSFTQIMLNFKLFLNNLIFMYMYCVTDRYLILTENKIRNCNFGFVCMSSLIMAI